MSTRSPVAADPVVWHDVECAAYEADLPLWRDLAEGAGGAVLDIGSGTGRVALDLASRGHDVTALDSEPAFVRALEARARARGLRVRTAVADARGFSLPDRFALAIAPMQVVQLMGGRDGQRRLLERAAAHLCPGGSLALAMADPLEGVAADEADPPVPDVREEDGWIYSSMPLAVRAVGTGLVIERLRQVVSPGGVLEESVAAIHLDAVDASELESDGEELGLRVLARRRVEPVGDYVGSTVVVLEAR